MFCNWKGCTWVNSGILKHKQKNGLLDNCYSFDSYIFMRNKHKSDENVPEDYQHILWDE